eukprot:6455940-Amphidinium_carterae.1
MVVMFDSFLEPEYLKRIFCVYELYTAATDSRVSVEIMLPEQEADEIEDMMRYGHQHSLQLCVA